MQPCPAMEATLQSEDRLLRPNLLYLLRSKMLRTDRRTSCVSILVPVRLLGRDIERDQATGSTWLHP